MAGELGYAAADDKDCGLEPAVSNTRIHPTLSGQEQVRGKYVHVQGADVTHIGQEQVSKKYAQAHVYGADVPIQYKMELSGKITYYHALWGTGFHEYAVCVLCSFC